MSYHLKADVDNTLIVLVNMLCLVVETQSGCGVVTWSDARAECCVVVGTFSLYVGFSYGCSSMILQIPDCNLSSNFLFMLHNSLTYSTCLWLSDPHNKPPVTDLQDGENYVMTGSNNFCYENSIVPTWRHTWTRIQVSYINGASSDPDRIQYCALLVCTSCIFGPKSNKCENVPYMSALINLSFSQCLMMKLDSDRSKSRVQMYLRW